MTRSVTGIRTLIVEDDASVCRLHVRYLEGVGGFVVVGTAATGAEAVEFASTHTVDLVLLDMHLPDFSGIEVLHRLRSLTFDEVDVIVVTSAHETVTVRQAAAARVSDYLVKPFSRAVFELRLSAYRAMFLARPTSDTGQIPLRQDDIDRLIAPLRPLVGADPVPRAARAADENRLPKGLAQPTVDLVLEALRQGEVSTAVQVAVSCGLARGTARRYLDYLRRAGLVEVTHRYGVRGRPELLYSRSPGARNQRSTI